MTSALACWLLWLSVRPGPAAQPRRPEILRLATAYELYGGLRRLTAAARGPTVEPYARASNELAWAKWRKCRFRPTNCYNAQMMEDSYSGLWKTIRKLRMGFRPMVPI